MTCLGNRGEMPARPPSAQAASLRLTTLMDAHQKDHLTWPLIRTRFGLLPG